MIPLGTSCTELTTSTDFSDGSIARVGFYAVFSDFRPCVSTQKRRKVVGLIKTWVSTSLNLHFKTSSKFLRWVWRSTELTTSTDFLYGLIARVRFCAVFSDFRPCVTIKNRLKLAGLIKAWFSTSLNLDFKTSSKFLRCVWGPRKLTSRCLRDRCNLV